MSYDCYCDYDSPEVYRSKRVKARKEYGCEECAGRIYPGDVYEYHFGVQYGDSYSGHTCIKCVEIRDWVTGNIPCYCWAHGNMFEDASNAIDEACYRAPEETVGIRFGFLRRKHERDEYHKARRSLLLSRPQEKSP